MIKRILKVIMFMFCFVLMGLACLTVPVMSIYVLIRYILTGKVNEDFIFIAIDLVLNMDIDFIDEL